MRWTFVQLMGLAAPGLSGSVICRTGRSMTPAGTLSAGSRLVFTYMRNSVITCARYSRRATACSGRQCFAPRIFGEHPAAHCLTLLEDLGMREFQERYLRPRNRVLEVVEIDRVAVAQPQ